MVPILECADTQELAARLAARSSMTNEAVAQKVKEIVADIRTRGDAALFEYTEKFDHVRLSRETVQVTREEIEAAYAAGRNRTPGSILKKGLPWDRRLHRCAVQAFMCPAEQPPIPPQF